MRYAFVVAAALFSSVVIGAGRQAADQPDVLRFRVGVDAVRIDAVVTDRDNRIVEDLTADDFEIKQDGKPQKVTFAQFMPVTVRASTPAAPAPITRSPVSGPPPAALQRSAVQRTLVLVIDDSGLNGSIMEL